MNQTTTLHHLARRSVRKLETPGPLRPREKPVLDLSSNACQFVGPEAQYPEVHPPALARAYLDWAGLDLQPENTLFTVGSGDGIDLLMRAFGEPREDKVCFTPPVFPMYAHWATACDLALKPVPLVGDGFDRLDVDAILAAEAKLTLLCTPNNPIGTSLHADEVEHVIARAVGLVVVDEAYLEYSGCRSAAHLIRDYENLVVTRTFSKAWGLASIRCGVTLAAPTIIHALKLVQPPYALSTPAIEAVTRRLATPAELATIVATTRYEREWLRVRLGVLPNVRRIFPSDANFLFVVCAGDARGALAAAGIAVADCGWAIPGALRITIGTREMNEAVLTAISKA